MKILHGLILLICTTFALSAQTTYYVSTTGDNGNTGSEVDPFRNIQFAIDSASAGDTVKVLSGDYLERLVFNRSGIHLQGVGDDVNVSAVDNILNPGTDTLISIVNQDDIVIRGLTLVGNFGADAIGVLVAGSSQNISIIGNDLVEIRTSFFDVLNTEGAYPIRVLGSSDTSAISGLVITNNFFEDNGVGAGQEISISGNVDGFDISNNEIVGSENIGVQISSTDVQPQNGSISSNNIRQGAGDAIHIDGATSTLVERNLILSNGSAAINVADGDNITVRNNLISANGGPSISLGDTSGTAINCTVRNNSTFNNGDSSTAELSIVSASSTSVINNIFSNVTGRILSASAGAGLVLNYNLYYTSGSPNFNFDGTSYSSLEEYSAGAAQDTNSIYGDPLYQSIGQGNLNFHLTMASPAIEAGDPNTVIGGDEVDAYGDLRLVGDVIDIGANEFPNVLPVTYLSPFKANLINDIVQMDWHTAEEINSDHFEVQRSTDLENWTTIVSMPSVGESHLYEAADREPLDGTTYYRLMQVDLDGSTDLSHIEIISVNKSTETRIFPNPAASWLRIEAGIGATVSEVRIFDLTGKMIMRSFDEGTHVTVDLTQLSTGTYVVQYRTNEGVKATKIQKN